MTGVLLSAHRLIHSSAYLKKALPNIIPRKIIFNIFEHLQPLEIYRGNSILEFTLKIKNTQKRNMMACHPM